MLPCTKSIIILVNYLSFSLHSGCQYARIHWQFEVFPLHCDCGLNSSWLSMWLPLWPLVTCRHRCPSFSKCWLRHSWNTPTFTSLLYNHSFNGRWFWTVALRCGLREAHSQAFLHPLQISDLSLNSFRCWLVEVTSTYCTASVEAQKN